MLVASQLKESKFQDTPQSRLQSLVRSIMFIIYKTNKEQPNFQRKNKEKIEPYVHFKVWQISIHGIMLQFDDENIIAAHT